MQIEWLPTNWQRLRWVEELTFLDNPFKYPASIWQISYPDASTSRQGGEGEREAQGQGPQLFSSLAPLRLAIKVTS